MALLWTTAADVTSRWLGDPLTAPDSQVEILLEDAEDTISREFPDVADRITEGTLPVSRVRKVAARMVIRLLRNPEGTRSHTETTGPFSENVTTADSRPGEIYLSAEDRADLAPPATGRRAFTIDSVPFYDAPLVVPWGSA